MKKLRLIGIFIAGLASGFSAPVWADDEADVRQMVDALYRRPPSQQLSFGREDPALISAELYALVQRASAEARRSAIAVKKSDYPTNKPYFIEGDLYSSMYEGFRAYGGIRSIRSAGEGRYRVEVELSYDKDTHWVDTVSIIREDGQWKIDDIGYDAHLQSGSAKEELLSFLGCSENGVRQVVEAFYQSRRVSSGWAKHFANVDAALISRKLYALIQEAAAEEARSAREIQNSDHPTDKPKMFEGDLYSNLYEGYSAIDAIRIIRALEDGYLVEVTLANRHYSEPWVWTDTVFVIEEPEGLWKIDDIYYAGKGSHAGDRLKKVLQSFITNENPP